MLLFAHAHQFYNQSHPNLFLTHLNILQGPPIVNEDPEEEILESYVSKSMDGQFMQDGDVRGMKVRERLFREKPFKTMHVCMATDVNVEVIKDGPYARTRPLHGAFIVHCSYL